MCPRSVTCPPPRSTPVKKRVLLALFAFGRTLFLTGVDLGADHANKMPCANLPAKDHLVLG